jgi:hypothetical protein
MKNEKSTHLAADVEADVADGLLVGTLAFLEWNAVKPNIATPQH